MSTAKIYVVGIVKNVLNLSVPSMQLNITCPCAWYKGMIGAFPCFSNLEDAKEYASGNEDKIMEFEVSVPTMM